MIIICCIFIHIYLLLMAHLTDHETDYCRLCQIIETICSSSMAHAFTRASKYNIIYIYYFIYFFNFEAFFVIVMRLHSLIKYSLQWLIFYTFYYLYKLSECHWIINDLAGHKRIRGHRYWLISQSLQFTMESLFISALH